MPTTVKPKPVPAGDITVVDTCPTSGQHAATEYPATDDDHEPRRPRRTPTARRHSRKKPKRPRPVRQAAHENRTFGTVLQAHQTIWATSGLLSTLNLLKSLTWPSTLPVIALPSAFFGSQQVDFNQWAWFFTVLRTLVIATASIAAYRIIFVGGQATT
jgi:hypothetical protein